MRDKEEEKMKRIYRTYNDTEVATIVVNIKCPYCGEKWQEEPPECGETVVLTCGDDLDEGCGKQFEMHFDAS